jgi:hypothetical protein
MRNTPIYAALLLSEAVLAFSLGVFGNKVAELLRISTGLIIAGAMVVILLLYVLTLARLRYESGERILPQLPGQGQKALFLNTVITVFPVGMAGGILLGILSILFLPGRRLRLPFPRSFALSDYELVAFLVGTVLLFLLMRRNPRKSLAITFSLGYALGSAATVLLLVPEVNLPVPTFLGTIISMLAAALVLSSNPFIRLTRDFVETISPSGTEKMK